MSQKYGEILDYLEYLRGSAQATIENWNPKPTPEQQELELKHQEEMKVFDEKMQRVAADQLERFRKSQQEREDRRRKFEELRSNGWMWPEWADEATRLLARRGELLSQIQEVLE